MTLFEMYKKSKTDNLKEQDLFTYFNCIGNEIDCLLNKINNEIITLHDYMLYNILNDIDYYAIVNSIPIWIRNAGHSQESAMGKVLFEKMVHANDNYLTHKLLYYYDCEMLIDSLQNRFTVTEELLNQVYRVLSSTIDLRIDDYENVCYTIDSSSIHTHACLNSIFINLASSCDLMTKIAFELEAIPTVDFSTYPKMRSRNITFGNLSALSDTIKQPGTYFEHPRSKPVAMIETFRDEIIHNGSLDFNYTIYCGNKGNKLYKWILFPDFDESGQFTSYKNRKKFYNDGSRTFNDQLPILMRDFLTIALNTLVVLKDVHYCSCNRDINDLKKNNKEILQWTNTFVRIADADMKKGKKKDI